MRLSRAVFARNSSQGAAVERACTAACMQAKFGCSESVRCAYRLACEEANEELSQAQGGSEPGRRGASRVTTADRVHAAAVVGKRANRGQRGRFCYMGFRPSTRDLEAQSAAKEHTSEARGDDRGPLLFTQDTCIVQVTLLVQIEHSYEK